MNIAEVSKKQSQFYVSCFEYALVGTIINNTCEEIKHVKCNHIFLMLMRNKTMVILILIISFMKYQNRLCLIILQDAMTEFE